MNRLGIPALLLMAICTGWCQAEGEIDEVSFTKNSRTVNLREWKYIVLHHSATEVGSVESIDAAHRLRKDADGNPWRGIGYHFLIGNGRGMKDGEVAATFRWKDQSEGAHAGDSQFNTLGIGICLVGNFEETPPTPGQVTALRELMGSLQKECRISKDGIVRHTDIKPTACPGKQFPWDSVLSFNGRDGAPKLVLAGQSN